MKLNPSDQSIRFTKKNRRKQVWYKVVTALSSVVVFCTTYALILPAITMSEDYYCGKEAHEHSDACYSHNQTKVSLCTAEPHQHEPGCFDAQGNVVCGLADYLIHSHNDICYDDNGNLVCTLEEHALHQHGADCYVGITEYSCGLDDVTPHVHAEKCWDRGETLICEIPEQAAHQHEESCYGPVDVLICELEECEGHLHTDVCYCEEKLLSCTEQEREAHHHDDSCYAEQEILNCTHPDDAEHSHTEECYTRERILICTVEETEGHIHTDSCYTSQQVLQCELEEKEAHTHGEACYRTETAPICGFEEGEGHQHDAGCYQKYEVLICGIAEGEIHQHDDNCQIISEPVLACTRTETVLGGHTETCYDENGILICRHLVVQEHIHTDECFGVEDMTEPVLICELEEHTHDVACTSDPTADVENAQIWRTTVPGEEELTGVLTEDLILVAKSQLGYQESTRNFIVEEDGTRKGYTRYGQWYGDLYGDWCAMFVSFCMHYAQVPDTVITYESSCARWIDAVKELEAPEQQTIYRTADDYVPVPGDVVFFGNEETGPAHVGIITEVSENEIKTVEGNTSDAVLEMTHSIGDENDPVLGYFSMDAIWSRGIELGELEPAPQEPDETTMTEVTEETVPESTDEPVIEDEERPAVQVECNGLLVTIDTDQDAFAGLTGSFTLTAQEADEDSIMVIREPISAYKTVIGLDLRLTDGETYFVPDEPFQITIRSDDRFANAVGFEAYQYMGMSDSGKVELKELNCSWDEEKGLIVDAEMLTGLVIAYEQAYDGIELTGKFGDIPVRLRANKDAFPVTAGNLTLMLKDVDESIRSDVHSRMEEGQPYFLVDIQILCDGEVIQPSAEVEVVFEMIQDPFVGCDEVEIFYLTMDDGIDDLIAQPVEGGRNADGDVVMWTNHFSIYMVAGVQNKPPMMMASRNTTPNTWEEALTDRSSYIGVESEGYADSPYTNTRQFEGANITSLTNSGGTVYVGGKWGIYYDYAFYAETFWDGKKPVRITSDPGHQNDLRKSVYSDWILEDTADPYGALKIDNVNLVLYGLGNQKFELYGRGNKIVIGENVNTDDLMGHSPPYIYGGSRTNDSTTSGYPTNVVVTSGRWGLVMGGGGADVNDGTQVTIRDTAEVGIIYGGGIDDGDVNKGSSENATNVYIEGGKVTEVYGGNQTTSRGIKVNGDINIDVSGGQVGTIHAGNDHRGIEGTDELKGSKVRGGAVVNVYNTGSVTNVVGDYMHYDAAYGDQLITFQGADGQYTTKGRHIRDLVELNIHSDNEFGYMDYWDIIRINNQDPNAAPNSVNVTSLQGVVKIGDRVVNNVGSEYIGRMEVTNGGRFYVKDNCFINFMNEVNTTSEEGVTSFNLNHAWMGESTQERQAWSTLAVEGSCIVPSTAATNLFTLSNPCDDGHAGLRIKGNVEGFSTLEACGEPMYSTGDTYYYYVVADSSDNGGKAFREPEGAPYVVCYRYLDDGRIGWYLRERPVLTMTNSLVRVGTEGTLTSTDNGFYGGCPENYVIMHVDMKGFAYEWSNTPGKNRVEFNWSIFDGYENAKEITGGISLQTMADIENNIYCTSNPNGIFANVEYNAMGTDEGSTVETRRVSSFYVIIDTSKAVNPRYYEVGTSFHYTRGEDDYDDLRVGQTANAARCTYDFDKEGDINEGLPSDGYANSIMTTYEYKDGIPPKGADDALLRVYLPEGVSANTLTVKELDEQFTFEKTGIAASLVSNSQVAQYYSTEEESTYNHKFGVTLQQTGDSEIDLAGGATLNNLSGKENYHCSVYSHEKISFTDITPESNLGLQLQLQLNNLTKDGNAVGNGDPSAVNDGELRIQVLPVGTIIETTTVFVEKVVVDAPDGCTSEFEFLLSYLKIDENGNNVTHEERFYLKHGDTQAIVVPLETEITIKEINHDGYHVEVGEKEKNRTASDTIVLTTPDKEHLTGEKQHIIFYNTPGVELPSTGGIGIPIHTLLGLALVLGAIVLFWMRRQGRRAAY